LSIAIAILSQSKGEIAQKTTLFTFFNPAIAFGALPIRRSQVFLDDEALSFADYYPIYG
jgi:hypothetical protein